MNKKNKRGFKEIKAEMSPFMEMLWSKEIERYLKCNTLLACSVMENKRQQKVINRLSRKIQRLKGISFKDKEITLLLYCIDLVIQNFGDNQELEKIYARLYRQRKESIDREKKGF